MAERLRFWIGGSTCSGKSTLARELAEAAGWAVHGIDDRWDDHLSALPGSVTERVGAMVTSERLARPAQAQADDVWVIAEERWPLVLDEVSAVAEGLVVEGEAILPARLAELGVPTTDAIFLAIAPAARRERYRSREWARELIAECPDPHAAFEAWMLRDDLTGERICAEARANGYAVVDVDTAAGLAAALTHTERWRRLAEPEREARGRAPTP